MQIAAVHAGNYGVFGARKVWLVLNRQGTPVARCTVERLMRDLGLRGVLRGKPRRTTIPDEGHVRPTDLVQRQFGVRQPNRLWIADFTYVPTWSGTAYVAFIIDAYSRRILGWRSATTMTTPLVLDALEHAIWARGRAGITDLTGLIHHSDAGSQYTSITFTTRLLDAGVDPSIGTVGDAYDNALAESTIGLYKTELIKPRSPVENLRPDRAGHPEMSRLVQPPPPPHRRSSPTPADFEALYDHNQPRLTKAATQPK